MKIVLSNGGRVTTSTFVLPRSGSLPPGGKRPYEEDRAAHQSCVVRSQMMPVPGCITSKRSTRSPKFATGWQPSAARAASWAFMGGTDHATPRLTPFCGALISVPSFPLPPSSSITPSFAVNPSIAFQSSVLQSVCWQKSRSARRSIRPKKKEYVPPEPNNTSIRPFLIGVKKHWIWIWNLGSNWFV